MPHDATPTTPGRIQGGKVKARRPVLCVSMAVSLLAITALAGCFGGSEADPAAAGSDLDGSDGNGTADAAGVSVLRPAVDPWADNETERLLFDDTVQAGQCYDMATVWELTAGYFMGGCAWIPLWDMDGALILEGTNALRIEADASEALHSGEYLAFLYSTVRTQPTDANMATTSEPVHAWTVDIEPAEWDHPDAPEAGVWMGFWTDWPDDGSVAPPVFEGPVDVRVVLEKDPDFEPLPVPDPWPDADPDHMPQPGVMTLMDAEHEWEASWASIALERPVPENGSQLAVGISWGEISNCHPGYDCSLFAGLNSRVHWTGMNELGEDRFQSGDDWHVLVFDLDDQAWPDSQYVDESHNRVDAWINRCSGLPGTITTCAGVQLEPPTVDVRYYAEVWQDEVDVGVFKERFGVS